MICKRSCSVPLTGSRPPYASCYWLRLWLNELSPTPDAHAPASSVEVQFWQIKRTTGTIVDHVTRQAASRRRSASNSFHLSQPASGASPTGVSIYRLDKKTAANLSTQHAWRPRMNSSQFTKREQMYKWITEWMNGWTCYTEGRGYHIVDSMVEKTALHCCKAHAKINRKMGNSTRVKL